MYYSATVNMTMFCRPDALRLEMQMRIFAVVCKITGTNTNISKSYGLVFVLTSLSLYIFTSILEIIFQS